MKLVEIEPVTVAELFDTWVTMLNLVQRCRIRNSAPGPALLAVSCYCIVCLVRFFDKT